MTSTLARRLTVAFAALAVFAIGASVVLGAIPNGNGNVYTCYSRTTGAMRVINYPTVRCTTSERMVALAGGTTVTTKHVEGTITTSEKLTDHVWIARFDVRTTPAGVVQFGYLELYGIGGSVVGQIHEFAVDKVTYFKSASGAPGARFQMREWRIVPTEEYLGAGDVYSVTDGSPVGQPDTFVPDLSWTVDSGNISIYTTSGQNLQ